MKDILHPQLLSKFGPKIRKSLVIGTCPKNLYYQKRHFGPLGVNYFWTFESLELIIVIRRKKWSSGNKAKHQEINTNI